MAFCTNCGTEGVRVRSRWDGKGNRLPDQCPQCSPETFTEKFTAPSDKKIWMGYEAHPNEYEKRHDSEGVIYVRKPEYRAEQEALLALPATDEREAEERAIERKRRERRTDPMRPDELLSAIHKAKRIADAIQDSM